MQSAKGYTGYLVLPIFRATAVSWSTAKYPAHETEFAAYAAAAYVAAVAAAAVRAAAAAARAAAARAGDAYAAVSALRAAAYGAAFAEDGAHAAVYADARAYAVAAASAHAATTASAAGYASDAAIRYFWSALSTDATRAEKGQKTSDIAGSPLWPHGQPDELRTLWQELAAGLLAAKQDWRVWITWYDDRLDGRFRKQERELGYVRIEEYLWDQSPAIVNAANGGSTSARRPLLPVDLTAFRTRRPRTLAQIRRAGQRSPRTRRENPQGRSSRGQTFPDADRRKTVLDEAIKAMNANQKPHPLANQRVSA